MPRGRRRALEPPKAKRSIEEELAFHIEQKAERLMAEGQEEEAAWREARRAFGDVDAVEAAIQRERRRKLGRVFWDGLRQDLRFALRALRRSPGFTVTAATTLALGIGASVAIFTTLDYVVLRPLPYEAPEELVYVDVDMPGEGSDTNWGVSEAGYFYLRDQNRTFQEIGAYGGAEEGHELTVVGVNGGVRVSTAYVSATLLEVLGAKPSLGRLILEEDDGWMGPGERGVPPAVVLGHDFWLREYGGDPNVVGTTMRLEGELAIEIVGVMEPGFQMPYNRADLWLPLGLHPSRRPDSYHGYRVIGRLAPAAALDDAADDLARLDARLPEAIPDVYTPTFMQESGFRTRVTPLRVRVLGGFDQVIWILFGAIAVVLVIACANVMNLFLVRAGVRRRDRAVRLALGIGRLGLARHVFSESVLLSSMSAGIGVLLAEGAVRLCVAVAPQALPRLEGISIGVPGVIAALAIGLVAGVACCGIQLAASASDPSTLRHGEAGKTASRSVHRMRGSMVVAEMALALVLLAGAGVMFRSFERLRDVDPGIDPTNVWVVDMFPPATRQYLRPASVQTLYRDVVARVSALPGVLEASVGGAPFAMDGWNCLDAYVEERPPGTGELTPCINQSMVAPGFFRTMGISLQGREPVWADTDQGLEPWAGGEVVVTRALADRLWPGDDPIGKGIRLRRAGPPYAHVVGVTGDLYADGLDRPPSELIFGQLWYRTNTLVVRTGPDASIPVAASIRDAVRGIDPSIAIGSIRTMDEVIRSSPSVARTSVILVLLAVGAAMGLLLSAVGTFGVLAYIVGQRRAEIAIRMAIGARAREVLVMVLRDSVKLVLAGAALGLLSSMAATRVLRSFVFAVTPTDAVSLSLATLVLIAVGILACWFPANRAARVDPMLVMRAD